MSSNIEQNSDPFQLEDSDTESDSGSSDATEDDPRLSVPGASSVAEYDARSPLAQDVSLGSPLPASRAPQGLEKSLVDESRLQLPLPAAPSQDETTPALYLPGLITPALFFPIPNTDQLSTLLHKYITPELRPYRDLTGEWQQSDPHSLAMSNSWRSLARMARDQLVQADAKDPSFIFELWYIRLSSLARLRLFNQAAAECNNLFSAIMSVQPEMVKDYIMEAVLPFELEVMQARTKYWGGDSFGYLDELAKLLRKCKIMSRAATDVTDHEMWKERAVRVGLLTASQLLEMKDHAAATCLLLPLCKQQSDGIPPSPALLSAVARVYLDAGDVDAATQLYKQAESDPTCDDSTKDINAAQLAAAQLDWATAVQRLQIAIKREPDNALIANNLAVALLSTGHLAEGVKHMETAMIAAPSVVSNVEPFLFNLCTLYELRTAASFERKCAVLLEVSKWAGDGLRATCLKLPTT